MFGSMTGGVENRENYFAHLQAVAVTHRPHLIAELRAGSREQLHVCARGQFTNSGQIVIVLVRVGSIPNTHALRARFFKIDINIAAHIEHERLACLLGADEVGGMSETFEVELLKNHNVLRSPFPGLHDLASQNAQAADEQGSSHSIN